MEHRDIARIDDDAQLFDAPLSPVVHADSDETLIRLWLYGRPATTQAAYSRDAGALLAHVAKPLKAVTLGDLQGYAQSLEAFAPASQARMVAVCKSLFGFGHRLGYLPFDTARPLPTPKLKDTLAERIITEADVKRVIASEPSPRNHALLSTLYTLGLRISEASSLRWRDMRGTKSGAVATIFGKGGKTRHIDVPSKLWRQLTALKRGAGPDDPVFAGQRGALDKSGVHRVVKAAAKRAGLPREVSSHWFRHSHASHSLDHNCPPHVLQRTMGHASLMTTSRYLHVAGGDSSSKYLPE